MNQKLDFYSDSGHGWLKIKIAELERLGIADKISNSSYMKDSYAYLEEDGDVSLYCDTVRQSIPNFKLVEHIREHSASVSNVRRYERYDYQKIVEITRMIKRFNNDTLFKKYTLMVIAEKSKSSWIDIKDLEKLSYDKQSKNFKAWFKHLAKDLTSLIKDLIIYRIDLFQSTGSHEKIEQWKKDLEEISKH